MNLFKLFIENKSAIVDKLLLEVNDIDIYCELTGVEFDIGKPVNSPLRSDDDVPSFSLFIPTKKKNTRPEEVWYRDFRDGSGDIFSFVKHYARIHYDIELTSIKEIIFFIDKQLELGIFDNNNGNKYIKKRKINYNKLKESKNIYFSSRNYTRRDLLWWLNFGIDECLLKKYDVRSVKHLLDDEFNIIKTFSTFKLAYVYVIYDKVKLYQPEAKPTFKWRNTCPSEYIQGWQQLEGFDTLIITKSLKDIMTFKSFMNVDVIAPQGESMHFTPSKINYIKNTYKNIYIIYDYDEAGKIASNNLVKEFGFKQKWVSNKINPHTNRPDDKDISDYCNNHGFKSTLFHLKNMFTELSDVYFKETRVVELNQLLLKLSA
jgi:5S rRNA maturation endonuclease (ribonuclease M5)